MIESASMRRGRGLRTSNAHAGRGRPGSHVTARSVVKTSVKRVLLSLGRILPERGAPVLLYHAVDHSGAEDSVTPAAFLRQMEYLHEEGYRVVPLHEIAGGADGSGDAVLRKTLAITFDDGDRSVYEHAWPILKRFSFRGTVFLPTAHVGGHSVWTPSWAPLLNWPDVIAMGQDGMQFGSHAHSHQDLTRLTEDQVRDELRTSKEILEGRLGKPVPFVAYPFSRSNEIVDRLAFECGYRVLFSGMGVARSGVPEGSPMVLRRSVTKKDDMSSFKFILANTYPCYFSLQRLLRVVPAQFSGQDEANVKNTQGGPRTNHGLRDTKVRYDREG